MRNLRNLTLVCVLSTERGEGVGRTRDYHRPRAGL